LSNLSDKELLEMMGDFPKHELSTRQRMELLQGIREAGSRKQKKPFQLQRFGAFAALLVLVLMAPILYFSNTGEEHLPKSSTSVTMEAEEGDYFGLMDEDGKRLYTDSNFGIPNKVSLLAPKEWVVWDNRGTSKVMVFLWGKDLDVYQTLNIDATHVETGIKEHLNNAPLSGGMYGADASAIADFYPFDKRGKWNLEFTVYNSNGEKKKIGEFSIYVKDHYVLMGNSTLLVSQEDLYAGFYEDAYIEVEGEDLPAEIELEIINEENEEDISSFTFTDKTDYTTTDGTNISMYKGDFQIKKSGKYSFRVLGQSNLVNIGMPRD